jgi:hypothetical protein
MNNAAAVDVLETAQDLVEEKANVIVAKRLCGLDDLCQIRLHQLRHHIEFVKLVDRAGVKNVLE